MRETWVRSLGREDPLEKEMSSFLAWRIPWTEEPSRLQSTGLQRVRQDSVTSPSPSPAAWASAVMTSDTCDSHETLLWRTALGYIQPPVQRAWKTWKFLPVGFLANDTGSGFIASDQDRLWGAMYSLELHCNTRLKLPSVGFCMSLQVLHREGAIIFPLSF